MAEGGEVSQAEVLRALEGVAVPEIGGDVVSRGLVRNVRACGGSVALDLVLPGALAALRPRLEEACRAAVAALPGVARVSVGGAPAAPQPAAPPSPGTPLPGVRRVIAVGSGKGGVGKSTVAVNLAIALALEGEAVGLLDADVYGPSIPMMMGVRRQPHTEDGKLVPVSQHGIRLMSLGFLMPDDSSHVIWRGPMVAGAVRQMLVDTKWGELDTLLVDLPPGTGDAQLTLAQSVPLTGAVVVMTSQDLAVNIASKAVGMFRRLNVPILGVLGNMDSFACPHCGIRTPIFTRGGSEEAARRLGVPFLGSIPLDPAAVEHGDRGIPTVIAAPDSETALAFREAASALLQRVAEAEREEAGQDPLGGLLHQFQTR